jgi:hypothetical protein
VQREQAQSRFARGRVLFQSNEHDKALQEFRASHEIVSSPNTRLLIARCLRALDRKVEAYAEFGRTAVEARELERSDRRYGQAASSAEKERRALESELGFVLVEIRDAGPNTTLSVAGEQLRRAAWGEPMPASPGTTEVVVRTPGRPTVRKTLELTGGQRVQLSIDAGYTKPVAAQPPPPPGPPSGGSQRTWAYVAGGVGVAGLATFAVAGLMTNRTHDDLRSACVDGACAPDRQDDIDAGRRQQTIANIGLAVGLVGVGTGLVLYLSSRPSDRPSEASAAVVVSPRWIGLRGSL